ncbi:hypothetical protein QYF36_018707 [Acer negundo]|nr:hypothetical protein QYF36_018707 [Acer negundo]
MRDIEGIRSGGLNLNDPGCINEGTDRSTFEKVILAGKDESMEPCFGPNGPLVSIQWASNTSRKKGDRPKKVGAGRAVNVNTNKSRWVRKSRDPTIGDSKKIQQVEGKKRKGTGLGDDDYSRNSGAILDNIAGLLNYSNGLKITHIPKSANWVAQVVINRISERSSVNASSGAILDNIAGLLNYSNGLKITHIPKSANWVAQGLAINALATGENLFWLEEYPGFINFLVELISPPSLGSILALLLA